MRKGAEIQGGQPSSGRQATGYGWLRPGFLTMPPAANDNRRAPRSLLRRPHFWLWLTAVMVGATWIATRF